MRVPRRHPVGWRTGPPICARFAKDKQKNKTLAQITNDLKDEPGYVDGDSLAFVKKCDELHVHIASLENDVGNISCFDIIDMGWSHTPDVTDYVKSMPSSNKLGYSSACRIDSLIFAQCFLEPRWSVNEAASALIDKAIAGKRLPDAPICGA